LKDSYVIHVVAATPVLS